MGKGGSRKIRRRGLVDCKNYMGVYFVDVVVTRYIGVMRERHVMVLCVGELSGKVATYLDIYGDGDSVV